MQVEEAGDDRFVVGEPDLLRVRRGDRQIAANAQQLSGAHENSRISYAVVARRGEEPTTADDEVALLRAGRPRQGDEGEGEKERETPHGKPHRRKRK